MTDAAASRPRIRLTPEEAWVFIERSQTGIFGTLRFDGMRIMLPIWFVLIDRTVTFAGERFLAKYALFRTDNFQMNPTTRSRDSAQRVFLELEPDGRVLGWDNRRQGL